MVVAVTGAGGFIGSRLVRALRQAGTPVRGLFGPPGAAGAGAPDGAEAHFGDIADHAALMPLIEGATTVVHLAGPPSVARSFQDPLAYAHAHVSGTAAVVDICARVGVRRLVYVSSAEVYGQPEDNPVDEETPLAPRSPYAAAKIGAEAFVCAGANLGGIEAVIVRPFSVYGPGMSPATILSSLLRQARRGSHMEIADPRPIRDFCFVDDIIKAIILSCEAHLPERLRIYNLGSGMGLSVGELAERILAVTDSKAVVRSTSWTDRPRQADIVELISDSRRAARELGWRATTDIQSGLTATLNSFVEECP